jgi:steroid delta-isomerase-like uncharacterized protein
MATDNREISRRVFEEIWNNRNLKAVDELVAVDYVNHDPQSPRSENREAYKQLVSYYLNAFPDLRFALDDQIAAGESTVTRWTATGTHNGDLQGVPRTGKRFSVTGITVSRISNGKMTESWTNWDALGLMQQLGAAEAKGRAA